MHKPRKPKIRFTVARARRVEFVVMAVVSQHPTGASRQDIVKALDEYKFEPGIDYSRDVLQRLLTSLVAKGTLAASGIHGGRRYHLAGEVDEPLLKAWKSFPLDSIKAAPSHAAPDAPAGEATEVSYMRLVTD